MTENTLDGSQPTTPFGTPGGTTPSPAVAEPSIVDTILKLDEFMSADVRLAEVTARFATRPDLEADIELLEAELSTLVDDQGRPLAPAGERAIGEEPGRTAEQVVAEIMALRHEYAASFRSIRLRQLNGDDWPAFKVKWAEVIEGDDDAKRNEMLDELVVLCAIAPKFTAESWAAFRPRAGGAAVERIRLKAWTANTRTGVDVPKSPLSSRYLNLLRLAQN